MSSNAPSRREFGSKKVESLPFTVEVATTSAQLDEAVAVRFAAYSHHAAPGAATLRVPELDDLRPDAVVLIARQKIDQKVIGTIRIQPNFVRKLRFEESVDLPTRLQGRRAIELMRLGVEHGSGGLRVTQALSKVCFAICHACGIDDVYVAGRRPVDAIYRAYLFDDILEGRKVEISYAPGALHSILHLPISEVEERWLEGNFALFSFMALTDHVDLKIDLDAVFERMKPPLAAA